MWATFGGSRPSRTAALSTLPPVTDEADDPDLALFWQGPKPKLSDSDHRAYRTHTAAKSHANDLKLARKAAERAERRGDPRAWLRFDERRDELLASFAEKKAKIDEKWDAVDAKAAERADRQKEREAEKAAAEADRRSRVEADAPARLAAMASTFGLILDLDADTVERRGQATGRFSGSMVRVESSGQISERVTATRILALGPFAAAAKKKTDGRELFLTVDGDGFQLLVKVAPTRHGEARGFAALYNTAAARRGQLTGDAEPVGPVDAALSEEVPPAAADGLAGQIAQLATLHGYGVLSDVEFAAAKARLLGTGQEVGSPQDQVPQDRSW